MLNDNEKDDLYYLCSLIEYTARKTNNFAADIVKAMDKGELAKQFSMAQVNHCLSFEQVSDELINSACIKNGSYDYYIKFANNMPRFLSIGKLYQRLIIDVINNDPVIDTVYNVFTSFLSYHISDYSTALYYSGRTYLKVCYDEGKIVS